MKNLLRFNRVFAVKDALPVENVTSLLKNYQYILSG